MHKLFNLRHLLIRMTYTRVCLILLIIGFCLLATLFLGAVLMVEYHWSALAAVGMCLGPWFLAIIITYILLNYYHRTYEREKAELAEAGRSALITKVLTFVITLLINRKKK